MFVDQECRRVIFHGRVQGVGFRYTTRRIARGFPVTGFVRNLVDGSVELIACGVPSELQQFLDAVKTEFAGNIDSVDDQPEYPNDFSGFEIRR